MNNPYKRETVALPSMRGVVELLERARAKGLKYPKLRLQLANGTPLHVYVSGENARYPGHLQLTDGGRYPANLYFGRITPTGELVLGAAGLGEHRPALVALLTDLAERPAHAAATYGHMTGACAFCGLPLSDERSTTVGYGPNCAEKYGMPWGSTGRGLRSLLED